MTKEQWKPCCDGFYQVSCLGRIRRARHGSNAVVGRILKASLDSSGYERFNAWISGTQQTLAVHAIVAKAFIGPRPTGMQINHKDGDKRRNAVVNLEYVTPSENKLHSFRTGLTPRKNLVFPQSTIDTIRRMRDEGKSYRDIASATGVSYSQCRNIALNKSRATRR